MIRSDQDQNVAAPCNEDSVGGSPTDLGLELTMASGKPNVLLIIADDVGWFDVGAYHRGIMGGATPNIDRIGAEGCRC